MKQNRPPTGQLYDLQTCEQYAKSIAIQLAHGHWPQAHETIEKAMRELPNSLDPVDPMTTPIADLDLPVRVVNAIEVDLGCVFVGDIIGLELSDFMSVRNMGPKSIASIRKALNKVGLDLPEDVSIAAIEDMDGT